MTTPVVFSVANGPQTVSCILIGSPPLSRSGGTSASASSGSGGWQVVDRTRQKAATEWLDYYPLVQTFTCLLDGGAGLNAASVEPACAVLESFELPVPGSQPPLPPLLRVSGTVLHPELLWVCSRLSFAGGDSGQIRNDAGERTQQAFTIELTEYSPSFAVATTSLSPAQQAVLSTGTAANQTVVGGTKSYTVVAGDTLQSIAATRLGNVALWTQIALLNGLSNSALLQPGQNLLLPTSS